MAVPVQVTFRDFPSSDAVNAHVARRAAKLETFTTRISRCHVVVEAPHRHRTHGPRFHVRIDIRVPGRELVISKTPRGAKEDLHTALDDAFADAERVLRTYASMLQPDGHVHEGPETGVVSKLFFDRGYGFLETVDGREIYFHENSVRGARFAELTQGTRVKFAEEDGDKGPQASTVHVGSRHLS